MWRSFRESEDACYVGLTLPRILLRRPYSTPVNGRLRFEERVDTSSALMWGNAAYAFGACVTNAFAKYSWCAAIHGVDGGGLVEGLPTVPVRADDGSPVSKSVTEIAITDRRERELADLGLIPLVQMAGREYAAFFSMSSCARPRVFQAEAANANSRLWTQLQYVLTVSRFAHYLRCIARDKVGAFLSRGQFELFLQQWLDQLVLDDDQASVADKASRPLREALVNIEELPGKPGAYRAVLFLRPHFQLDELSVSMRLVVNLPSPAF
jgi:type VI secretion system protein ImpC